MPQTLKEMMWVLVTDNQISCPHPFLKLEAVRVSRASFSCEKTVLIQEPQGASTQKGLYNPLVLPRADNVAFKYEFTFHGVKR